MGTYFCFLLVVGTIILGSEAFCPAKLRQIDPSLEMNLWLQPYLDEYMEPDQKSSPGIPDKVGKLTRRFNNLIKITSGAEAEDKQVHRKAQEMKTDYMEASKTILNKYEEELKALVAGNKLERVEGADHADGRQSGTTEDKIKELLEGSKVKFYSNEDFTGEHTLIKLGPPEDLKSCKSIKSLRQNGATISTLDTLGTCVRLFKDECCSSVSLAVYPGFTHQDQLAAFLPKVSSVGPCFRSEFQFSNFTQTPQGITVQKDLNNLREIPPLTSMEPDKCGEASIIHLMNAFMVLPDSLARLVPDCNDRIAWFVKRVRIGDVQTEEIDANLTQREDWKSVEKEPGDIMGFIISPTIGGCSQELENTFPQSVASFNAWNRVTERVVDYLVEDPSTYVQLYGALAYPTKESKRPHGLFWRFEINGVTQEPPCKAENAIYGYIPN